jgi:16S rRNA processing protein RimM
MVVMGRIGAPYGVRGWVKVQPFSAAPDALLDHATWWIGERDGRAGRPLRMIEGRLHAGAVVAKLEGIDSRETAATLKGLDVAVPRDALPDAEDDEVYLGDLVGFEVVNRSGIALGRVAAVSANGAQPLLRLAVAADGERLIPFVPAIVDEVDLDARRIVVDWEADY